jgi:Zn ribbon nucleic-acid-binding protein
VIWNGAQRFVPIARLRKYPQRTKRNQEVKMKSQYKQKLKPNQAICPKCRTVYTSKNIIEVVKCGACGYDKSKIGDDQKEKNE